MIRDNVFGAAACQSIFKELSDLKNKQFFRQSKMKQANQQEEWVNQYLKILSS